MHRPLWDRAGEDLRGPAGGPTVDPIVWEHSVRVARLAEAITAMPEVANHVVDRTALIAAALYHDAGWLLDLWAGRIRQAELLLKRTSDDQRDRAADWMTRRLADILEPGRLRLAVRIIRECHNRATTLLEARILADAENLDQVGPQAVWLMVRKQQAERRTIDEMMESWRRQEQYGYWSAWIKECLQFPSARTLARRRWRTMSRFMADLEATSRIASADLLAMQPEDFDLIAASRE